MNEEKRQWGMNYNAPPKEEQQRMNMNGPLHTATVSNQEMLTYMTPNQAQQEKVQQLQQQQVQPQSVGVDGLGQNEDDEDMVRFSADLESLLSYPSCNSDGGSARVSPKYFNSGGEGDTPFPVGVRYNPTTCPTNSKISPPIATANTVGTSSMDSTGVSSQQAFRAQAMPAKPLPQHSGNGVNLMSAPLATTQQQQPALQSVPQYGEQIQHHNIVIYKKYQPQLQLQPPPQPPPPQAVAQSWMVPPQGNYNPVLPNPNNMQTNLSSAPVFPSNYVGQQQQQQQQPQPQPQQVSLSFSNISNKLSFPAISNNAALSSPVVPPPAVPSNTAVKRTRVKRGGKRRRDSPSVCPSTTNSATSREKPPSSVSEDEEDKQKRRLERNLREQERSHRITDQIAELRDLLNTAKLRFKPDKYSTLTAVSDYIKSLQKRSIELEDEHRKLLTTISHTNEVVNNPRIHGFQGIQPPAPVAPTSEVVRNSNNSSQFCNVFDDGFATFCRGLDYKGVFTNCLIPTCVTGVDGRILDCNNKFCTLFVITKDQLNQLANPLNPQSTERKQISVFNLIENNDMRLVFSSMSEMLKSTDFMANQGQQQITNATRKLIQGSAVIQSHRLVQGDHWSGVIRQCNVPHKSCCLNISLVRNPNGLPQFFNCSFTPIEK